MEIVSALLALGTGNPPVTAGFPSQKPVPRNFDGFFDLRLNMAQQTIEAPVIWNAIADIMIVLFVCFSFRI